MCIFGSTFEPYFKDNKSNYEIKNVGKDPLKFYFTGSKKIFIIQLIAVNINVNYNTFLFSVQRHYIQFILKYVIYVISNLLIYIDIVNKTEFPIILEDFIMTKEVLKLYV